ncbi:transmembrane efflux protein [Streptomyces iranensis]|uniref:Transmembrane efflux protein n=4 Tax=Streptomyces iranensis TaxID=576784 RepID=A0A061A632_9ACTN|nr:transmembrane efflux protein [Streptomyces iranensis]
MGQKRSFMAWSVLRERTFRRFFIGETTSLLGDGMTAVALSFAVLDLNGSAGDLGFVMASGAIPMVATLLIGGVLADRFSRRRIMVTADLVRLACQGIVAALLLSGHAHIWQLAAFQAVQGVASAAFGPACAGLVPSLVSGEHLQRANALRGMALSSGNIAGPVLAGLIVSFAGPGWAIAADAATFGVSAFMLSRIPIATQLRTAGGSFTHDLLEGWSEFRSRTWLWMSVATSSLSNLLLAAVLVLGPFLAEEHLGGPAAWASMSAFLGVGLIVGGMIAMHLRSERQLRTGIAALVMGTLPTFGLALELSLFVMCSLEFIAGVGLAVFGAMWATTMQRNIPEDKLSRVSAYANFGLLAGQPFGHALVGPMVAAMGVYSTLWVAAAIQLLSALVALSTPAIWRLRTTGEVAESEADAKVLTAV